MVLVPRGQFWSDIVKKTPSLPDFHGNKIAEEGCDRCDCGCKYWEDDCCIDCGTHITMTTVADRATRTGD